MSNSYLAATAALALLTILPGPDLAMVTRYAIGGSRRDGIRVALGVVVGLTIWGVMAVVGLAALLAASSTAYLIVKIIGAIFLVGMGIRALWHSRRKIPGHVGKQSQHVQKTNAFRSGLITNLFNPKIAVFYTGLLPSLVPSGESPHVWLPVLVLTHLALSLGWLVGYAIALSKTESVMARPRVRLLLERVTGSVLIALGLRVATGTR